MKSPSRTGNGRGKSFSERKRQLLEAALTGAIQAGRLLRVNDSQATVHIKSPSQ